jgi:SulP family sulfate permease
MPDGSRHARWGDLAAGLCVAGLLIPEAVAYAGLAQLPVAHALIASMIGLAIYAVFGGSRFAIVSPTSSTATLAAAAVLSVPAATGASQASTYVSSLMALVLMTGLILMVLAWARQGMLSAFVSRPVLRGFAFALGITIVIKQLPDALGLSLPSNLIKDPLHVLAHVLTHLPSAHWASAMVAAAAALVVWLLRRWPKVPASMAVIVLAILAAQWLDLTALGVAEVGAIERPTLMPSIPDLPTAQWLHLSELAFGLVVLVFAESWGSMRTMALNHGDTLDADRELLVLGACNVAAGLMQGMVVGAGFSASSANAAAGAHSRRSGGIALVVIVLTLLVALPAMHLLPRPVLAVTVISALWHALSPGPLLAVWRMNRDRWLIIGAVAAVLMLGVLHGMLAAIALSLIAALKRFSQPVMHELGALGHSRNYVTLDVHPEASSPPDLLILRPEEPLFFASAERVVADVMARVAQRPAVKSIVLSLEESSDLDSTAAECLLELDRRLSAMGRTLSLARVKEPVRALLHLLDPTGVGQSDRLFWSVADAVQAQMIPRSAI